MRQKILNVLTIISLVCTITSGVIKLTLQIKKEEQK